MLKVEVSQDALCAICCVTVSANTAFHAHEMETGASLTDTAH